MRDAANVVTLGEGFTPIVDLDTHNLAPGVELMAKDDGILPTGSFKARGMTVAVSRARELGLKELFVPSAGNAGAALAAYTARAGLAARVYLPERTPDSVKRLVRTFGAEVIEIQGTIREAGEQARLREKSSGAFDMSTLREPYRVEGKKTMGFEIVDQLGPESLPDVIVYPTGGGTGLVGMAKAFRELRDIGLLERSPRLCAVQPEGCAPVIRALREGATRVTAWDDPSTVAPGLLVPSPFSSELILQSVRETRGAGVTVKDREIVDAMATLASRHGVFTSPEAAATYAALPELVREGALKSGERALLYLTGTGLPFSLESLTRELGGERVSGTAG